MKLFFLLIILSNLLISKEKIALLIGNSEYRFQPLINPINDVNAIKKSLLQIGFKQNNIVTLKNVSQQQMKRSLFQFEQKASQAEIALIYFSGHGIQVDSTNYLFPANTTATKLIHLEGLIKLDFLIASANSARYGVVLVDACRNNPLVQNFHNSLYRGSIAKKGLGQVKPKRGEVVIGFATEADQTASDGHGNTSPYVQALIKSLPLRLDIRKVLGQVGLDVAKATNYEQNPILHSTLGRLNVCLTGECGANSQYNQEEIKRLEEENEKLRSKEEVYSHTKSSKKNTIHIGRDFNGDINQNNGDVINYNTNTKVNVDTN